MRRIALVALLLVAIARSASAQASQPAIDPGMSRDQVVARLGKPASEHSSGTTTYLYYRNGQEKKMGMSDMVALENGQVVDAVFRSSARRYTGKSSSPAPVSAEAAMAKGNGGRAPMKKTAPSAKTAAAPKTPAPVKIAPPEKRLSEPLKRVDAKKIQAPTKSPDTTKKAAPAPAKKP